MRLGRRAVAVAVPTVAPVAPVSAAAPMAVRVLVVEERPAARRQAAELLAGSAEVQVVAAVGTIAAARLATEAHRPDVAVLDVRLPDGNGLELSRTLRAAHPALRTLIFTEHDDRASRLAAAVAGASGYLLKDGDAVALHTAVREVAAGRSLLDAERSAAQLLLGEGSLDDTAFGPLTDRERTVRVLLLRGHTDASIAALLDVDERTVRADVALLLTKMLTVTPPHGRRPGASLTAYLARVHRPESAWM